MDKLCKQSLLLTFLDSQKNLISKLHLVGRFCSAQLHTAVKSNAMLAIFFSNFLPEFNICTIKPCEIDTEISPKISKNYVNFSKNYSFNKFLSKFLLRFLQKVLHDMLLNFLRDTMKSYFWDYSSSIFWHTFSTFFGKFFFYSSNDQKIR